MHCWKRKVINTVSNVKHWSCVNSYSTELLHSILLLLSLCLLVLLWSQYCLKLFSTDSFIKTCVISCIDWIPSPYRSSSITVFFLVKPIIPNLLRMSSLEVKLLKICTTKIPIYLHDSWLHIEFYSYVTRGWSLWIFNLTFVSFSLVLTLFLFSILVMT